MTRSRESTRPLAVGLDFGSTFIKAGLLDESGRLTRLRSAQAPALEGEGPIRECDGRLYLSIARCVLAAVLEDVPRGIPLGLASQRSSLLLWDRESGEPRTPLISWQDRRAAGWCDDHLDSAARIHAATGLVLSAHYAGPKLAQMLSTDALLREQVVAGRVLFGNLDSWALWRWGIRPVHETDRTMAARTLMLDLDRGDWGDDLLERFGVPRVLLPTVLPTTGRGVDLEDGPRVTATVADQAAGVISATGAGEDAVLITLGTGGFVLRPIDHGAPRLDGYLTAPVFAPSSGPIRHVLEGTVNGAGAAIDRFPGPPGLPTGADPSPAAFCLPDVAGLGSPYWRPDIGLRFSTDAARLDPAAQRRIVTEGLLFRLYQILADLSCDRADCRVLLSGGVATHPDLAEGLAALLGHPVEILEATEAGIVGAARIAAGLPAAARVATRIIVPGDTAAYLREKFDRWRDWLAVELDEPSA